MYEIGDPFMGSDEDPIEEDLREGRLGEYGEFDGWPEDAYENHPVYTMLRAIERSKR